MSMRAYIRHGAVPLKKPVVPSVARNLQQISMVLYQEIPRYARNDVYSPALAPPSYVVL